MPYLLDSDILIDYLKDQPTAVRIVEDLTVDGVAMSILSYIEIFQGAIRDPRTHDRIASLLVLAPTIPVSRAVAERCARLRELLQGQGRRTGSRAFDLVIAATALEHGLTLVTRNSADYRDIAGLQILSPEG